MKARDPSDPTSWRFQANIHGTRDEIPDAFADVWATCQHGTFFFLSWHRMYLYYFERILRAASAPLTVERGEARTTASVGIALASRDHDRPETLIEHADRAMYRAKTRGGNRYELFAPERGSGPERGSIEKQLRQAIELGELRLVYQPLVQLDTGAITGVEALVRWEHPDRGELLPAEFIPVAEESGLIVALGRLVLEEACRRSAAWSVPVHVNLSARQMADPNLADSVAHVIRSTGVDLQVLYDKITKKLNEYVIDPKVTVSLEKAQSAVFSVVGNMAQPGIRPMTRRLSVSEAVEVSIP